MKIQYFDRQSGTMKFIELPEGTDSIGIDVGRQGLVVEVNTDAVQVLQLGQRISMYDYDDLLAEITPACEHNNAVLSDDNEPATYHCPDCGDNFIGESNVS